MCFEWVDIQLVSTCVLLLFQMVVDNSIVVVQVNHGVQVNLNSCFRSHQLQSLIQH